MKRVVAWLLCLWLLLCTGCGKTDKHDLPEQNLPPEITQPSVMPPTDLESLQYRLMGRWKTVWMEREGEALDAQEMDLRCLEENLIFTMERDADGTIFMHAAYRRYDAGDMWEDFYRVESQLLPVTAWRSELESVPARNTQWSAHLMNLTDDSGCCERYIVLEDAEHLTLLEVCTLPDNETLVSTRCLVPMGLDEAEIQPHSSSLANPYVRLEDAIGSWEGISGMVDGSVWYRDEGVRSFVNIHRDGDRLLMNLYRDVGDLYGIPLTYVEDADNNLYCWHFEVPEDWGGDSELTVYMADADTLVLKHFFYYDETIPVNAYEFLWRSGFAYDETAIQRQINDILDQCPEDAKVLLWREPWYHHELHYPWLYSGQMPIIIACAAPSASIALYAGTPVYDADGNLTDWTNSYELEPRRDMPRGDYMIVGVEYPWRRDANPTQYLSIIIDGQEWYWPIVDTGIGADDWCWIN